MPVISVTLLPGYAPEVQHRLVQRLAVTARSVIAAAEAGTTVFIQEVSTYQRNGQVFTGGGAARPVAGEVVRSFLNALAERQLDQAARHLSERFEMVFPDQTRMRTLAELVDWSRPRYQSIQKHITHLDESWRGDGAVVYVSGHLSGVFHDGTRFEDIRFIDRFEVVEGKIERQDVWNDLGVVLAQRAAVGSRVEP
jgi:phenylpyruvate tautomerase PptA (4-oxalocrotonate tautomerase family)/limonene-1,2-epoxide hydrolase